MKKKFLVISYDDDQQQPYFDFMLAEDRDHAIILAEGIRPESVAVDALVLEEMSRMATDMETTTEEEIRMWMDSIISLPEEGNSTDGGGEP